MARSAARPTTLPTAKVPDDLDWSSIPSQASHFPPAAAGRSAGSLASAFSGPLAAAPLQPTAFAPPHPPRRRPSGGMPTVVKVLLGVIALGGGGLVLLAVLAVSLAVFLGGRPQAKVTMSLHGWSAQAPGSFIQGRPGAGARSVDVYHRTTNSEFSIATKQVAQHGQSWTVQEVLDSSRMISTITDVRPVSRGELQGFRFTMRLPMRTIHGTVEMFKVDPTHILILSYIPGQEREKEQLGKARFNEDKTRQLDDPEAFFASLRRSG